MNSDVVPAPGGRAWVSADVLWRFRGFLPDPVVEAAVAKAAGELRGQVPPGAFDELLHRLVAYRLRELASAVGRKVGE